MSVTTAYLDEVRARHAISSDNKLAAYLGINRTRISSYRGGNRLTEEHAVLVANALDVHPAKVMAEIRAERAKCSPVAEAWRDVARLVGAWIFAGVFSVLATLTPSNDVQAKAAPADFTPYTLCEVKVWLDRLFSLMLVALYVFG